MTRRRRSAPYALLALLIQLTFAGCKSSDSSGNDAGPTTCGDATCTPAELCVGKQNCGTPTCTPLPDGGTCPAGSSATPSCPDGGPAGCFAGCPEAKFACAARPGGCATAVDCTCAASLCSPGSCLATMGSRVACQTQ